MKLSMETFVYLSGRGSSGIRCRGPDGGWRSGSRGDEVLCATSAPVSGRAAASGQLAQ
jgi:hypothetical protein